MKNLNALSIVQQHGLPAICKFANDKYVDITGTSCTLETLPRPSAPEILSSVLEMKVMDPRPFGAVRGRDDAAFAPGTLSLSLRVLASLPLYELHHGSRRQTWSAPENSGISFWYNTS